MFTGIIEDIGTLAAIRHSGKTAQLLIQTALPPNEFALGDSIAVNGACLTIENISGNLLTCHCLAETLAKTNLGQKSKGDALNLERALKVGGRLGGHFVTGHIDFTAPILFAGVREEDFEIQVKIPAGQELFFVEKGSVALDGVSLTIARLHNDSFTVCIIPHTAKMTTLFQRKAGDSLNIETDILGKYILRATTLPSQADTDKRLLQKLQEFGF